MTRAPILFALALLCTLCQPFPSAASGKQDGASFDALQLRPYFEEGPLREAAARMRAQDYAAAARLFSAHLERHPRGQESQRARFLLGMAQLHLGHGDAAARAFDALIGRYAILDNYHRLLAARGHLLGKRPREAEARLLPLIEDAVLACEARFYLAEARAMQRRVDEAVRDYEVHLAGCAARRAEVSQRLAELLLAGPRAAEALPHLRRLYLEHPTESQGAWAEARLSVMGAEAGRYSAKELLLRAQVLFDNMRNPESEAAYRRVLEHPELTKKEKCIAQYQLAQSVFKQRQRPRAAPLFDEAARACEPKEAEGNDLHMKALYQAARCHGSKGELEMAAGLFAKAEAAHPDHSYADDARLRQGEMYLDLSEKLNRDGPQRTCQAARCPDYVQRMRELYAALPDKYPAGDQRAEALWRLAFFAYRRKDLGLARRHLEDALGRIPRESGWDQEGRTLYFLGRVAEQEGQREAAVAYFRRAVLGYPLSYYCLMALNRLRDAAPAELDRLLKEVAREPEGISEAEREWRFADRPLFHTPGFLRGLELLRLSLGKLAQREFAALGIKVPEGKGARVSSPEEEERLWLAALLYNRAGEYYRSHFIPRHTLVDYKQGYPVGALRKRWLLSYPRGYEELLTSAAKQNGHPEALQFAIVREESAFDPLNESFANAIGLTQMILPTARRFAEGLPTTREALRDPAINVAIGARFLGFLWTTMQGHPALAVAGYNAGEGAVFRWLKERGDYDADAFIEAIPYDETRGYTKRVLASFLTYSWLAADPTRLADSIPLVPLKLPALPQVRKGGQPVLEDPHRK